MWLALFLLAFVAACETGDELAADAGHALDSGTADAAAYDGADLKCQPAQAAAPVALDVGGLFSNGAPTWLRTDDGLVAVAPGAAGQGYQISRFTSAGEQLGQSWTVFPDLVTSPVALAAVGGVLALAQQAAQPARTGGTSRTSCKLGLLRLADHTVVQAPVQFSDPTEEESLLNETALCAVAAMDTGFVVAWQQFMSRTSDDASLFAQRIGIDGALQGERVTLLANTIVKQATVAAASDAARVAIAFRGADQAEATLAFIEPDALQMKSLPGVTEPFRELARAHDGYLLRTSSSLWQLDAEGRASSMPYASTLDALAAPLGDGYVEIKHEEFLVARSIDATLSHSSDPLGISDERSADALALLFAADGGDSVLIYADSSAVKLLKLGCGTKLGPPGPKACPREQDLQPLDFGCSDPVCHVSIRLDYLTLGVRGWSASGGPSQAVDATQATSAAQAVFDANSEHIGPTDVAGPAEAGLYSVNATPSDFGAFALVGEHSGIVVAAGGVVWSGRGNYWTPQTWHPASDIRCGNAQASPSARALDASACATDDRRNTTASQAMQVALSTNLALAVSKQGSFQARAFLYTPSVGLCSADDAEWLVVLTKQ